MKNNVSFIKNSILLSSSSFLAGLFGYGFQILIGRSLSVGDYAAFSSVLAVSVFLVSPINATVLIYTRKISIISASGALGSVLKFYKKLLINLFYASILILFIGWLFFKQIYVFLNFKSAYQYYLTILITSISAVTLINMGVIHGLQQFNRYAALTVLYPFLKAVFALSFILLGFELYGALTGVFIASIVVCIIGFKFIESATINSISSDQKIKQIKYLPILIASICLTALTQLDVVIVNKFFDNKEAGIFAAVSTLGKSILYVSGGVIAAIYPVIARMSVAYQSTNSLFKIGFASIFLACSLGVVMFKFFGAFIITMLFGVSYSEAGNLLWLYSLAIMPMALTIFCENYMIAKGSVIFAWLFLVAAPIEILAIYLFSSSLLNVITIIGISNSTILISGLMAMYINFIYSKSKLIDASIQ
ncbi:hypothetical protein [Polynucleobacter sp. MWH-UH35A]|uniref:hypothetical protein n=1 Tax=Polynucleobacter sp. MWH-UH35A TaxID=1855619 RepID=UPI001BFE8140|nr:hypothetical protein [Polynucleobacter sp. MWH-UH35A]QWD60440.1 hypothetical protein ICV36_01740 [Polynucleobacter sp. MWH-UH35A]